jgi:hypothetical protein
MLKSFYVDPSRGVVNVHQLGRLSTSQRVLAADDLASGGKTASGLSCAQVAHLAGVSVSYLSTVAHCTPAERQQLRSGALTISALHNSKRKTKPDSDNEIDRIVERIGPERLLAALDRYTAPQFAFAAAE